MGITSSKTNSSTRSSNSSNTRSSYQKATNFLNNVCHLGNLPSHGQWIGKTFTNSTGISKPTLWDVNKKLYNLNYYLTQTIKTVTEGISLGMLSSNRESPIKDVTKIACDNILKVLDDVPLNVDNPATIKQFSERIKAVEIFLDSYINNNYKEFKPKLGDLGNQKLFDNSDIHFSEIDATIKQVFSDIKEPIVLKKCEQILDENPLGDNRYFKENLEKNLRKKFNKRNEEKNSAFSEKYGKNLEYEAAAVNENRRYGFKLVRELLETYVNDVKRLFEMEIYYLEDCDINGNPEKNSWRAWDYSGTIRRSGVSREDAVKVIKKFKNDYMPVHMTTISQYFNKLENYIKTLSVLSQKLDIYYDQVVCGSLEELPKEICFFSLKNDDSLVINDKAIKFGDYNLSSYTDLCKLISSKGDNLTARLISPPPPAAQVVGGNSNHPAQQDVMDLFTVLKGKGDDFKMEDGNYILFESNEKFVINGAKSTFGKFINLPGENIESRHNTEDIGKIDRSTDSKGKVIFEGRNAIGPYWKLIGPVQECIMNAKKDIKRSFFNDDLLVILSKCFKELGYELTYNDKDKEKDKEKDNEKKK